MIGQTFFHAFNPTDPMFRHNLYVGRGRLSSASAVRDADPALAGIMSPYQALTQHREKEECFEQVRLREFPELPTRLGCIFLFLTREGADRGNAEWWNGVNVILEARIVSAVSVGTFDARQLEALSDQWEAAARRYWAGEFTADPRPEVVLCGTIQLAGWEPHARLGP
jgi:hypothetical protein